jgi:DNA-binding NarL/FixJ family response regulator
MTRPRVLIADDHNLVAELCKQLLETEFDVVGLVSNGRALVQVATQLKPDVIVLDIAMPVLNGLDAGQQAKEIVPAVKLVFLTVNPDTEVAAEAFTRGASAYLVKTCASDELVRAVREVLQDHTYVSRPLSRHEIDCLRWQNTRLVREDDCLTRRQREVLQLLAEGKAAKEVGGILNMSTRTVCYHKYRMMKLLRANSNADLVKYAVRNNLVPLARA